ncbi:MAG: sigma-70 family RNA polymerase sigma factor [Acidobacteriota bacterium]|nr:sigma-70 family RNA polymerase sigma factor [Acidobacteriota bacterium]
MAAAGEHLVFLYNELRVMARHYLYGERSDHTLSPTALVNEVYLRVAQGDREFRTEGDFLAAASRMMRHILVDYARSHNAVKRGGGERNLRASAIGFDVGQEQLLDVERLDESLKRLAQMDARQASVVEMRFFGGLTYEEIGEQLGISAKTAKRDWATARAWLEAEMTR